MLGSALEWTSEQRRRHGRLSTFVKRQPDLWLPADMNGEVIFEIGTVLSKAKMNMFHLQMMQNRFNRFNMKIINMNYLEDGLWYGSK